MALKKSSVVFCVALVFTMATCYSIPVAAQSTHWVTPLECVPTQSGSGDVAITNTCDQRAYISWCFIAGGCYSNTLDPGQSTQTGWSASDMAKMRFFICPAGAVPSSSGTAFIPLTNGANYAFYCYQG